MLQIGALQHSLLIVSFSTERVSHQINRFRPPSRIPVPIQAGLVEDFYNTHLGLCQDTLDEALRLGDIDTAWQTASNCLEATLCEAAGLRISKRKTRTPDL